MDPDQALKNAREAVKAFRTACQQDDSECEPGNELADAFEALDGWLSKGGFLPQDWEAHRREPSILKKV